MKPSDEIKQKYPVYSGKDAETIEELCEKSGLGESTIRRFAEDMVKSGSWKQVMVRGSGRFRKAYVKVK